MHHRYKEDTKGRTSVQEDLPVRRWRAGGDFQFRGQTRARAGRWPGEISAISYHPKVGLTPARGVSDALDLISGLKLLIDSVPFSPIFKTSFDKLPKFFPKHHGPMPLFKSPWPLKGLTFQLPNTWQRLWSGTTMLCYHQGRCTGSAGSGNSLLPCGNPRGGGSPGVAGVAWSSPWALLVEGDVDEWKGKTVPSERVAMGAVERHVRAVTGESGHVPRSNGQWIASRILEMQSKQRHMVGIQRRGSDAVRELSREIILITILGIRCKSVIQPYWRKIEPVQFSKRKNAQLQESVSNHYRSFI